MSFATPSANHPRRRVAITGVTGFVGGSLARRLVEQGDAVVGLARPTSDRRRIADLDIEIHFGDVLQQQTLLPFVDGCDVLIHAAGRLGQAHVAEATYHQLHVDGTRNLLDILSEQRSPPRLLYISSPGVLGPIAGDQTADESWPLRPSNPYERSKAAAEQLVQGYRERLPLVIARPEFIYGPGDLHVLGLFRAVQKRIFFTIDGGDAVCHPTYIGDALDGLLLALDKGRDGAVYNIAGPRPVTFRHLGDTIADALGVRPPWLNLPAPLARVGATALEKLLANPPLSRSGVAFFSEDRRFSWQKAHAELGYTPRFDLEHGVRATVAWYRRQGLLS